MFKYRFLLCFRILHCCFRMFRSCFRFYVPVAAGPALHWCRGHSFNVKTAYKAGGPRVFSMFSDNFVALNIKKRNDMRKFIAVLLCAVSLCATQVYAQASGEEKIKAGDALPAFSLHSQKYGDVVPADLKGKVVLVSLFATWCGPCQLELAEVQKTLWPEYKDNKDFRLLVIGREHTEADLEKYNARKKFSFPLYPDPKREAYSLFADNTIPRAYLFGKDGRLVYSSVGYTKAEFQKLMEAIAQALAQ